MNFFSIHQFVRYMTLGVVLSVLGIASAHASDLSDALKKSDYVLLMRHALAPGVGDPSGYSLQDCKTQRNLDSKGREQAQRTGQWLKAQGVEQFYFKYCSTFDSTPQGNIGPVTENILSP